MLRRLGLTSEPLARREGNDVSPAEPVDPNEIALLLLKNAIRLLEQASAPPDVMKSLKFALSELESHIARRGS